MPTINYAAVVVAALANFVLGGVWYAVFGKAWMECLKLRKEDLNPSDPLPYVTAFVGALFNAFGLACLIDYAKVDSLGLGLTLGGMMSIALAGATMAKHYAFSRWPLKLFGIDYGLDLLGFLVMSTILTLWRP